MIEEKFKMLKVFIGWDKKNALAYEVCARSLMHHSSIPLEIIPLHEWDLRYRKIYWRSHIVDETGQMVDRNDKSKFSTDFSFTRFAVPKLMDYANEWALFLDSDILWRNDIAELYNLVKISDGAVHCVKHEHKPFEQNKMYGLKQTFYQRKNWSSLMFMYGSKCSALTLYAINNWSGEALHGMTWVDDSLIGDLPKEWNYLVGYNDLNAIPNPSVVHFTLGTPDMPLCSDTEYALEWNAYAREVEMYGANKYIYNPK
jgi:hypothetical protein